MQSSIGKIPLTKLLIYDVPMIKGTVDCSQLQSGHTNTGHPAE